MRILITRPEPDADDLANKIAALGHKPIKEPLIEISFTAPAPLYLDGAQALIATSKNGLRALKSASLLAAALNLPIFTVGKGTAIEAARLGFKTVIPGPGTAADLIPIMKAKLNSANGKLVHLAGADLAADLATPLAAAGFELQQPILYQAKAASALSKTTIAAIASGKLDAVTLLSPRTAATYARLVADAGLTTKVGGIQHLCLSGEVARHLEPLGMLTVFVPQAPNMQEFLALIADSTSLLI